MSVLLLVPTAGESAAQEIADYVVNVATSLNADIEVLHIIREGETEVDARKGGEVFRRAARDSDVTVRSSVATGDIVNAITAAAEERHANLIVMGASRGQVVEEWISADVMTRSLVPVLVVPHCYRAA